MAESKFDRQLKSLIAGDEDVNKELDNIPDEGEEEQPQDMSPVTFDPKESGVDEFRNKDIESDYKFARSNAALELTLKIAAMSEHPRAMEVASTIMKTSADMTKQLLELQKSVEEQKGKSGEHPKGHYEQHNHYYGEGDKSATDIDGELDGLEDEDNKNKK